MFDHYFYEEASSIFAKNIVKLILHFVFFYEEYSQVVPALCFTILWQLSVLDKIIIVIILVLAMENSD
jgi:hypothetical protein